MVPAVTAQALDHASGATAVSNGRFALVLACIFLIALPVPNLIKFPAGASLALLLMLVSIPTWFLTARARYTPFDLNATRAIAVILASAGFLIIWSLLSTFGTKEPLRASRFLATQVAAFALYFLVRGTITQRRVVLYIDILAVGLAATSALSLLAYEVGALHRIIFGDTDRAAGLFKNPNQFGMAISTATPAVIALFLAERRRRLLRGICLTLMLLGLVASGSKTNLMLAWVTILAVLCGHSLIAYTGSSRIRALVTYLLGSFLVGGLGIVALSVLNPRALAIMSEFVTGDGEVESLLTRSYLWKYSLDQFFIDPFLGQGAGQRLDIFYREADVSHSHNVLLDYMRTLGAPGLMAALVMIGTVVLICLSAIAKALWEERVEPYARIICMGLALSCVSYVAANMSSDSFGPSTSPFFWIFTYLLLAMSGLMRPLLSGPAAALRPQPHSQQEPSPFPELVPQWALDRDSGATDRRARLRTKVFFTLLVAVCIVGLAIIALPS